MRIDGIKLSRELVQFNWVETGKENRFGARFFRRLAEARINIVFLCHGAAEGKTIGFCCVEIDHFEQVRILLDDNPPMGQYPRIIAPVGTVSVFPRRSDAGLLGAAMSALGRAGFSIHGIGTSISAITFSLDYPVLDRAADALGGLLNLPPNAAPFRSEFRIIQTSPR